MKVKMKTSTMPSLRVTPEPGAAAESVLKPGETLSSFVEQSLRVQINRRQLQREFVARGLASLEEAKRTGEFYDADEVLQDPDHMLAEAEAKARR
jgi:predicted transcriptional regulator